MVSSMTAMKRAAACEGLPRHGGTGAPGCRLPLDSQAHAKGEGHAGLPFHLMALLWPRRAMTALFDSGILTGTKTRLIKF